MNEFGDRAVETCRFKKRKGKKKLVQFDNKVKP